MDLGRPRLFSRVALDAGDNLGDQARGWRLEGSLDGRHWRTLGSGAGTAQLITVDTGWTVARQLRVSATRSADSWWSIADIRLYR